MMDYYQEPEGIYCEECKDRGEDLYYNEDDELCCRCAACRFNPGNQEDL